MIQELKKFIRFHLANSIFRGKIENAQDISNPVVQAVDNLNRTINGKRNEIVNPQEISDPIVEAQNRTTTAVESIKIPEIPPVDFSALEGKIEALKTALEKKDLSVNIGKTNVEVDTKSVVKAIEKLEKNLPKFEKQEIIDYTLMFDEMMKIMESPKYTLDLLKIQDGINRLATSDDMVALSEWLKKISEKEFPKFPEFPRDEHGIPLFTPTKLGGGGGGGLTAIETGYLKLISDDISYNITDIDDAGYFGFTDKDGKWYIMKELNGAWRYLKGDSGYAAKWTSRATNSYDYYYNVF